MPSQSNQKPAVLVVDDSSIVREMMVRSLGQDYHVLTASNATDALTLIYHQAIAIALLDVSMPGIDGLELCRTIRSIPQVRQLPIVMVTGKDTPFDKVKGRLAGATEYLTKPCDPEELQRVISQLIGTPISASPTNTI